MKLSELLGVPLKHSRPNAYELIGLEPGEADNKQISAAIAQVTRRLKSVKADADPKLWNQAARAVSQSRTCLTDPRLKAEYDAKLGFVPTGSLSVSPFASLVGSVLPSGSPDRPFDMIGYTRWISEQTLPSFSEHVDDIEEEMLEPIVGDDWQESHRSASMSAQTSPIAEDQPATFVNAPKKRRRRRLSVVPMFVGLMVFGMIGGVVYLAYRLTNGQPLAVARNGDTQNHNVPVENIPPQTAAPENEVFDPVMGRLPAATSAPTDGLPKGPLKSPNKSTPMPSTDSQSPSMASDPVPVVSPTPSMVAEAPAVTPAMETPPDPVSVPPQPSEEEMKRGEQAVAILIKTILERRLTTPDDAIQTAEQAAVADNHLAQVDQLRRMVTYAREYDRGLRAGSAKLNAGETFELTPGQPVNVVEGRSDMIVIRAAGKNKEFSLTDPPLILAHALVRFSLDVKHPTTQAFRAAYQALAKNANDADRRDAINLFKSIAADPAAEGEVDVSGLDEAMKMLFGK